MRFQVLDDNNNLVSGSHSLAGAKTSARGYSKREKTVKFSVVDMTQKGAVVAAYLNNQEQWL